MRNLEKSSEKAHKQLSAVNQLSFRDVRMSVCYRNVSLWSYSFSREGKVGKVRGVFDLFHVTRVSAARMIKKY